MKKNKLMRLASCLLVGTLLTTCAISGTFAKYTTQDAANDSARVAKWGITLQIIGDLYSDSYKDTSTTYDEDEAGTTITVQANADATDKNLVAPGTWDETGLTIKLNGTPEVDYQAITTITHENIFLTKGTYGVMIKIEPGITTQDQFDELLAAEENGIYTYDTSTKKYTKVEAWASGWTTAPDLYTLEDYVVFNAAEAFYPVVYSIQGNADGQITDINKDRDTNGANESYEDTIATIANTIAKQFNQSAASTKDDATNIYTYDKITTDVFDANTSIATNLLLSGANLTWKWDFDDDADGGDNLPNGGDDADLHDKLDTILGNLQAGDVNVVKLDTEATTGVVYEAPTAEEDYNLETRFSIDITVNQVD